MPPCVAPGRSPPRRACLLGGTPAQAGSTAAAIPAAPPWRPRHCHHGDRVALQRPGGSAGGPEVPADRKSRHFRRDGRHGGRGGGAAARAAAAAGGGGEGRAAQPPAQSVATERGAAGPGRTARGQQVRRPSRSAPPRLARPRRSTPPVVPQVAPAEEQVREEEPLPARQEEPQPQPAPRRREGEAGERGCRYSGGGSRDSAMAGTEGASSLVRSDWALHGVL